ncbi:MAG: sodium:calcium antiporter, partial [Clostridia bacterium]|nr:sodium:calcium antiporter [Clostridia bacterium]
MLVPVLLLVLGFVLLIKGGDWFVDGATGIARRFHLPELLIGATVVSIGTTLPEVMVSAGAAFQGSGSIAYGNAIGSIICNTSLIAAITIAVRPSTVARKSMVLPVVFFFGSAALYCGVAYFSGYFSRTVG